MHWDGQGSKSKRFGTPVQAGAVISRPGGSGGPDLEGNCQILDSGFLAALLAAARLLLKLLARPGSAFAGSTSPLIFIK